MAAANASSVPHLDVGEVSLLNLAGDDPRDAMSFSDKEALALRLYNQVQEQELEKALLEQETEFLSRDDAEEQLALAERELLQSRATYTVRRKAVGTALMTDPTLKVVHMKATSPAERVLLRLINRRDILSFVHENLTTLQNTTRKKLSDLEVENVQINRENQDLVRQLLDLTSDDSTWREELEDTDLKEQLRKLEGEHKRGKAKWEVLKNIASATVVGSGVNWAEDKTLSELVLDEMND